MANAVRREVPDAGNPHIRFGEGEVASAKPRRGSLLYVARLTFLAIATMLMVWCAEAAGRLPYGYTELTHITLGGAYFNLGIPLLDSYQIEMVFKLTSGNSLFGAREGANANDIACVFAAGNGIDFNNSDYSKTRYTIPSSVSLNSTYYVSVSREQRVIRAGSSTGSVIGQADTRRIGDSIRTPECYLFRINGNQYATQAKGYLYSFKITDVDVGKVVREFVPCRKLTSGVVGLYDISDHSDDPDYNPFLEPLDEVAGPGDPVTEDDDYEVVAYWPFGSQGTVDASGHGNDLVVSGVSFDDGCVAFDGGQTKCQTALPVDLRAYADGLTVEMFIKTPQGAKDVQILIEQSEQFNKVNGTFMMDVGDYNPGTVVAALKTKQGYNLSYSEESLVNDGEWHHLAMVFSSKMANVLELYVDGELKASKKLEDKTFPLLNNDWLFLGSRANSSMKFIGKMDDVKITAGVLPKEYFMRARSEEPGEVLAYWPFCRGKEKIDASGSGHPSDEALALGASAVTVECFAKKNGEWHHFARVYGAGAVSAPTAVYLDGKPYAGSDYNDVCVVANGALMPQFAYSDTIDDVRVTAAALQPSVFLKTRTVPTPKTLHFWRFNRKGIFDDDMGRLPLASAGGVCQPYAIDGALKFPMSLGLVTAQDLNLSGYTGFTVEMMVKYPADVEPANILEFSPNMNSCAGSFNVCSDATADGHPGAIFKVTSAQWSYNGKLSDGIVRGDDQWHHWAFSVDRSGGSIKTEFYIDGVRQTNDKSGSYAKTTDTVFYNGKLNFGFRSEGAGSYMYRGMLDDVKISAGVLKPDELMTVADRSAEDPVTVAHWTFDGQDPLADISGNGHRLTGSAAVSGGQAVFDGAQALNTIEPLSLVGSHQVTVEAVFRLNDVNAEQVLFELGGDPSVEAGRFTVYYDGNGSVVAGIAGSMKRTVSAAFGANGLWHHLALIIDLEENTQGRVSHLFVDGKEETSTFGAGVGTVGGKFSVERLFLGARNGASSFFKGALWAVRVSSGVCVPEEFLTLPGTGAWAGDGATVAYWPFESEDSLADAAGHGFTLQTDGGVSFTDACADFQGTGSGLVTVRELPFAAMDKLTVEFFAKARTSSSGGGLVASGMASGLACEFAVSEMANGTMQSRVQTGAYDKKDGGIVSKPNVRASSSSLADGRWHHYALVIDRSVAGARQCLFYVDGVEQSSKGSDAFGFGRQIADAILTIGANADGTGAFNGKIDDVRISAAALAPSQFLQKRTGAGLFIVVQ